MESIAVDKLYMNKPCPNCPFRKKHGISCLGESRARQIVGDLPTEGFVCHKTTGVLGNKADRKQCAGSMIYSLKTGTSNIFVDTYVSMFGQNPKLSSIDSIVDTMQEFIKIQS